MSGANSFYVNSTLCTMHQRNVPISIALITMQVKFKKLLYENGFEDVWENQCIYDPDAFMYVFRQRLIDINKQNRNARLTESPRDRFYRVVINDFEFYDQLDKIHNKSHRRCSSPPNYQ